ncbi:hypothetical protein XELAEV_18036180mg, partial [Xenopus laevis]
LFFLTRGGSLALRKEFRNPRSWQLHGNGRGDQIAGKKTKRDISVVGPNSFARYGAVERYRRRRAFFGSGFMSDSEGARVYGASRTQLSVISTDVSLKP